MSEADVPEVLHTYLAMWREPDQAKREALLAECVSDDVVFADPQDYHEGRDALAANTKRFHETFPGAVLSRTSEVDIQNRRHRYTWRIELDGKTLIDGMDVTTLNDDGRIERIDGFFGPIQPLKA